MTKFCWIMSLGERSPSIPSYVVAMKCGLMSTNTHLGGREETGADTNGQGGCRHHVLAGVGNDLLEVLQEELWQGHRRGDHTGIQTMAVS